METVNTKHDAAAYERAHYQREICEMSDANLLYDSYLAAMKSSAWKTQVQQFEMNFLIQIAGIQRELRERNYHFLPGNQFVMNERGKTRYITGEQMRDRVTKHALCDGVLTPATQPYLIYDNGASQKGKGVSFTRGRLVTHLRRYYRQHGSNDGFILLIDDTKYYDNIRHAEYYGQIQYMTSNQTALYFLEEVLRQSRVDVSYMTDEEYANCINVVFNSLEHNKIDKRLLTGEKFMAKHLNIGDQVAQNAGIVYQIPIDNYIKIVRGVKYYGRYNDDSYIIHESCDFLKELLAEIIERSAAYGITINPTKTRICKLSQPFRFMKVQYWLTDTGRVVQKIHPKRVTAIRRLMKKLVHILPKKEFEKWYGDWMGSNYKLMSKQQRENMDNLFCKLMEEKYEIHNYTCRRHKTGKHGAERQ